MAAKVYGYAEKDMTQMTWRMVVLLKNLIK